MKVKVMKIKNFLMLWLLFFNVAYCAEGIRDKLVRLDDNIRQAEKNQPNAILINDILRQANEIQKLNNATLEEGTRAAIAREQIDLVDYLMNLKLEDPSIKNKIDKSLLKVFLQDIYNNNQSIGVLYKKYLGFANSFLASYSHDALEELAKNSGITLEMSEKDKAENLSADAKAAAEAKAAAHQSEAARVTEIRAVDGRR